jgi:hypothetical protein
MTMTDHTPSQAEGEPDTGTDTPAPDQAHDTGHADPVRDTPSQAEGDRGDDEETAEE